MAQCWCNLFPRLSECAAKEVAATCMYNIACHVQNHFVRTTSCRGFQSTMEPRFNELLYKEVLSITNNIFQPSNSVMYGKEPPYNEPSI